MPKFKLRERIPILRSHRPVSSSSILLNASLDPRGISNDVCLLLHWLCILLLAITPAACESRSKDNQVSILQQDQPSLSASNLYPAISLSTILRIVLRIILQIVLRVVLRITVLRTVLRIVLQIFLALASASLRHVERSLFEESEKKEAIQLLSRGDDLCGECQMLMDQELRPNGGRTAELKNCMGFYDGLQSRTSCALCCLMVQ